MMLKPTNVGFLIIPNCSMHGYRSFKKVHIFSLLSCIDVFLKVYRFRGSFVSSSSVQKYGARRGSLSTHIHQENENNFVQNIGIKTRVKTNL
jgi:hypothetical protein